MLADPWSVLSAGMFAQGDAARAQSGATRFPSSIGPSLEAPITLHSVRPRTRVMRDPMNRDEGADRRQDGSSAIVLGGLGDDSSMAWVVAPW